MHTFRKFGINHVVLCLKVYLSSKFARICLGFNFFLWFSATRMCQMTFACLWCKGHIGSHSMSRRLHSLQVNVLLSGHTFCSFDRLSWRWWLARSKKMFRVLFECIIIRRNDGFHLIREMSICSESRHSLFGILYQKVKVIRAPFKGGHLCQALFVILRIEKISIKFSMLTFMFETSQFQDWCREHQWRV